jgi:hypothetical protein
MPINLLIVYARSGGTIMNQCLAALPKTVVLSELSQWGGGTGYQGSKSKSTVWEQAESWYDISLKSREFIPAILELEEHCLTNDLHLIIRDWTYASFTAISIKQKAPSRTLETLALLEQKTTVQTFCLTRNVIDVWISSGKPPLNSFFETYESYIKAIIEKELPLFKYEDFCIDPDQTMKSICGLLSIPFDPIYKKCYNGMEANGNTQMGSHSRGIRQQKIAPLKRKWINPAAISEINNSSQQITCNQLMNYEATYFDERFNRLNYCIALGQLLKEKTYTSLIRK